MKHRARLFSIDVVGFPSRICQRGSASPSFGEVPKHIVMSDDILPLILQVWIPLTAFLHLLALRDRQQAGVLSETHTAPEDAQSPRPSRAEILGACVVFWEKQYG